MLVHVQFGNELYSRSGCGYYLLTNWHAEAPARVEAC